MPYIEKGSLELEKRHSRQSEVMFRVMVDGVLRSYGIRSVPGLEDRFVELFMKVQMNAEARGMVTLDQELEDELAEE